MNSVYNNQSVYCWSCG